MVQSYVDDVLGGTDGGQQYNGTELDDHITNLQSIFVRLKVNIWVGVGRRDVTAVSRTQLKHQKGIDSGWGKSGNDWKDMSLQKE